ncbi:hypothetical protein F0170_11480 [Pseudomonas sp. MAFF 730085]|uniref:Uncharacterized protein n=1 Tax=Pseudomonas kitaguniensis TaxID=2607908 RepID=A0A5N7JTB4_9PSED|nr:hypothetical protein [Pseudomonas kitaguniensis]MPQ84555.1 hypothetical protein [Pseudomonas kitaguniensis]
MLVLPDKGIASSVKVHNCDVLAIADWLLGSSLFCEEDVSRSDVSDILIENQVYSNQDFCQEFLTSVWGVLESFVGAINSPVVTVDSRAIRFEANWKEDRAFAYCLAASLRVFYEGWSKNHCGDYLAQGFILEELTKLSLAKHHPNIRFKSTGWSGVTTNQKFADLVSQICQDANFAEQNLDLWDTGNVKDLGLDVYGYFPGQGRRPSAPFMMFQCASGANWKGKRTTPDLQVWKHVMNIYSMPIRGMAVPFLIDEMEFSRSLVLIGGPLVDRPLLLSGLSGNADLPQDLQDMIDGWVDVKVSKLETL